MSAAARTPEPTLLEPKGVVITVIACVFGTALTLAAGTATVYCVFHAITDTSGWVGWVRLVPVGLALIAAFVTWVGISTVLFAVHERRETLRLAADGVDASARLLAVSSAPPSTTESEQIRLLIRVTGPGFESFEHSVDVEVYAFGDPAPGTTFPARVNPANRVFSFSRGPKN